MTKLKKAVWWNFVIYMIMWNVGVAVVDLLLTPTFTWWHPISTLVVTFVTYPFLRRLWSK